MGKPSLTLQIAAFSILIIVLSLIPVSTTKADTGSGPGVGPCEMERAYARSDGIEEGREAMRQLSATARWEGVAVGCLVGGVIVAGMFFMAIVWRKEVSMPVLELVSHTLYTFEPAVKAEYWEDGGPLRLGRLFPMGMYFGSTPEFHVFQDSPGGRFSFRVPCRYLKVGSGVLCLTTEK